MRPARAVAVALAAIVAACAPDAATSPTPATSPEMRVREVLDGAAADARARTALGGRAAGGSVRVRLIENWPSPPGTEPLYVIDGVPLTHNGMVAAGVNPAQILDIRMVQGRAAVRSYGPAARHGALLIRTRRE